MADHKAIANGGARNSEESVESSLQLLRKNQCQNKTDKLEKRVEIYENKILPALRRKHIVFYQNHRVETFHEEYIKSFFKEEIFPQPTVPLWKDKVTSFLRDNRLYLAVRLYLKGTAPGRSQPYTIFRDETALLQSSTLYWTPRHGEEHYIIYIEDIIKANINSIFRTTR